LKQFVNGLKRLRQAAAEGKTDADLTYMDGHNSVSGGNDFDEFDVTFSSGSSRSLLFRPELCRCREAGNALKLMNIQIVMQHSEPAVCCARRRGARR
jgi:hypothetical protein